MKKIVRVAVVIPKYGLTGGAENFAAELTGHLAQNTGYEFHVFANQWTPGTGSIRYHKIPIISFPKFLTTMSFACFAGREIAKMDFDIVHTHDRIFNADIYSMHGIPHRTWVYDIRKKKRMSLFDLGTQWVEKKLVANSNCRKFLAVSHLTKDKFLQEYGTVHANQVEIIHPGVDITRFQKYQKAHCRKEIRKRFGIGQDEIVLLFASMNFDIRGLDLLINGLARLKLKRPESKITLFAVGKGNERRYRMLARDLGIEERIIFNGIADTETLEKIYLACDMFSILSQFDTFSITVLEAMAASLPVIISSNVGAKDLIREGINGFVIDEINNPDKVANKIEMLLDRPVRERMAAEALQTASLLSWPAAAKKVEAVYGEVLRNR
jgi:UDP-glucose:(heptosyl)LPS alpha-1,3-glucosyltransferase